MAQTVEMHIGAKSFFIELNGNDAARDFASRLPMELQFEDFAGTERIAYLNPKLNVGEAPTHMTPQTGDVAYYIPWGNLAVFVNIIFVCLVAALGRDRQCQHRLKK